MQMDADAVGLPTFIRKMTSTNNLRPNPLQSYGSCSRTAQDAFGMSESFGFTNMTLNPMDHLGFQTWENMGIEFDKLRTI